MPVYNPRPIPFALYSGEVTAYGNNNPTANNVYLVGVYAPSPCVLVGIRTVFNTSGNGNYDLGIYDANGNLLNHKGAAITTNGIVTYTLGTPLLLQASRYWLALWIASATDSVLSRIGDSANEDVCQRIDGVGALPATTSGAANTAFKAYILGLLQGSWS